MAPLLAAHIVLVVLLSVGTTLLYVSTLRDLRLVQPGYPHLIVLSVATPPLPFKLAHSLFPALLVVGTIVVALAVLRIARAGAPPTSAQLAALVAHTASILLFLLIFLWAHVWCSKVMRYVGAPQP